MRKRLCKFKDCVDKTSAKGYCQKHYDKVIAAYWRRYRLTPEIVADQLGKQNGNCALHVLGGCSKEGPRDIDHDHQTGALRGLLCHKHNMLLGYLEGNGGLCDMKQFSETVIRYVQGGLVDFLQPVPESLKICEYEKCRKTFQGRRGRRYCAKRCAELERNRRTRIRYAVTMETHRAPSPEEYQQALEELK